MVGNIFSVSLLFYFSHFLLLSSSSLNFFFFLFFSLSLFHAQVGRMLVLRHNVSVRSTPANKFVSFRKRQFHGSFTIVIW